jgi:outer membrane protein assembly factor BamA
MRILCLLGALLVARVAPAGEQSLLAEADEGQADLGELLRLSGSFWTRVFSRDRPEGNPFEDLARGLRRYDVTPEIGGVVSGSGIGLGFTHALWHDDRSAIRLRAFATTEGYYQLAVVHDTLLDRSGRFRLRTGFLHRDLAQEDFFGIGLESHSFDRTDYRLSETAVGSDLDFALTPTLGLRVGGDLRQVAAGSGENRLLPSPELLFTPAVLAGYGESFTYATFGASLFWDTRDVPAYPRRGSLIQADLRQFVGLGAGDPGFRRFGIELQNALPLPGHDHGLVARFRADWLDHGRDTALPFFFSRGLGGSHSLRGFPLNRFRGEDLVLATVEYRSAILPGKLDAVVFWDTGGAYRSFSEFSPGGLVHSFGAGIRVLRHDRVILRLEVARGSEGTRFLVSFSRPF